MCGPEPQALRGCVAADKTDSYEKGGSSEDCEGGLVFFWRLRRGRLRWGAREGMLRNGKGGAHCEASPPVRSIQRQMRDALQMVGLREEIQQMHVSEAITGFY
jgi:hypothetical protein